MVIADLDKTEREIIEALRAGNSITQYQQSCASLPSSHQTQRDTA